MEDKNSNGEKIALTITVIIIVCAIIYLLYVVFLSNKNIKNNVTNTTNSIKNDITNSTIDIYEDTENIKNDIKNDVNNKVNETSKVTTEEVEISAFTTTIYDKDEGRIHNITLANQKLNGTIIKQGEEFSFIGTVGTMGESEGYKKAMGFDSEGRKIQIFGGGICQLSSTLYNAALQANLEITERHPHSTRVYYVPKDKDATIFYPSLDLKFINNTDGDIKISVTNDEDNVTVKLYKITTTTKSQ